MQMKKIRINYSMVKHLTKWVFYQVISCVLPLTIGIGFSWFLGYKVKIDRIFTDLLLGSFAIGMNLNGVEIKNNDKIKESLQDFYQITTKITIFVTIIMYSSLFNGGYIANYFDEQVKIIKISDCKYWSVTGFLTLLLFSDIIIACYSEYKKIEQP